MNRHGGRRRALRIISVAALLVSTIVAFTACSGSKSKSQGKSKSSTTTTKPGVVRSAPDSPRTTGYIGARKDVTDFTCKQEGKVWKVGGTVKNPTTAPADYRIFTSFLDKTNDTRGLLQTDVNGVAPGEAKQWNGELGLASTDLHCVLRVERTGVGGAPPPTESPTSAP